MLRRTVFLFLFSILFISSFDSRAFAQWPANGVFLNEGAYGNRRGQRAISDDRNGMIVTWEVEYPSNDAGIYAARIDGAGNVSWTVELSYLAGRATDPDIAPDGFGGAYVVWSEYVGATDYDIKLNRVPRSGANVGNPFNVCSAAGAQVSPRLAAVSTNNVIIAWQDQRTGVDIYAQRWTTGGNMWAANGIPICTATGEQWTPRVAADGSGGAIIGWDDGRSASFEPFAQRVNASGTTLWTGNGVNLCGGATGSQWLSGVGSDGSGGGIFSWIDNRWYNISGWDVYAQRVNGSGALQWGANGTVVTNAAGDQDAVTMAASGTGAAWFVWNDKRNSTQGDIYMDKIDSPGGGAPNDYAVCTATGAQLTAGCSADPFGRVLISWTDYRNGNADVYVQKMAFLADWTTNGVQVTSSTGTQFSPVIVTDQAQGALVAWLEDVGDDQIIAGRVTEAGSANPATYFQTDGYAISTGGGVLGQPVTLSDGSGGFFATWADTKTGAGDIYLQHYNGAGFVDGYWPALPYNLSSNASLQEKPAIAAGTNWVIVAWEDSRNGNKDIYAHWVNRIDGGLYTGGVTGICTATGDQTLPSVASDATSENFFLAWTDARSGTSNLDIYATRIRSNGPTLAPNGVPIATAIGNQSDAKVIWDNVSGLASAGAIISWRGVGIYGQRMNNAGSLLWTAGGVAIESATAAAGPTMVPDGSGGAMVEYRKGSPAAVYVRRVDSSGGFPSGWGSSVLISPLTQSTDVTMVQDGPTAAIVGWLEQVGTMYTVRVSRIGTGGAVASGWPSDGRAVRSGTGVSKPSVCRDGIGGAVVAWQENANIYVSRVVFRGWLDPNYGATGTVLCGATGTQDLPSAVFLATGSAAVVWRDGRSGANSAVFAGKTTFDVTPPATIPYVNAEGGCQQITVGWTAPADDGSQPVAGYELAGWPMLHIVPTGTPQSPGSWEEYVDPVGFCAVDFYYTLTSWDECGNMAYATTSNTASTWCGPPWNCVDFSNQDAIAKTLLPGLAKPEPNPARDHVKLSYVVSSDQVGRPLELSVFDVLGRRVAKVHDDVAKAGLDQVDWNLKDASGMRLSGGMYYLRLTVGTAKYDRVLVIAR